MSTVRELRTTILIEALSFWSQKLEDKESHKLSDLIQLVIAQKSKTIYVTNQELKRPSVIKFVEWAQGMKIQVLDRKQGKSIYFADKLS